MICIVNKRVLYLNLIDNVLTVHITPVYGFLVSNETVVQFMLCFL